MRDLRGAFVDGGKYFFFCHAGFGHTFLQIKKPPGLGGLVLFFRFLDVALERRRPRLRLAWDFLEVEGSNR
jgi:hypothetical protein